jgi:hypothetical protein
MWRTDIVKPAPDSWSVVFDPNSPYKGKVTAYDDSVYIADAAVHLMATQPDLNITNPYELDDTQFQAAVDLLKQQKAIIGEYWSDYAKEEASFTSGDSVVGTTWQSVTNFLKGEKVPVESTSGGRFDWILGQCDDQFQGRPPQLHVPLDEPHRQSADECDPDGVLRGSAFELEVVRHHVGPGVLHELPRGRSGLLGERLLLDHASGRLRRRPRGGVQGPQRVGPGVDRDSGVVDLDR